MADRSSDFQHCLDLLRGVDRDRYLACLLVPEAHRGALAALYAFNAEIARIRDIIHDPMPGEIRLQWWRDLISGTAHGAAQSHPVAAALLSTIAECHLPPASFERYLDARTFDLYDDLMPDRHGFEAYAGETASTLIQLAALCISPEAAHQASEAAGHAGVALQVAGSILLMPIHRSRGQVYVPGDILSATGLTRETWLAGTERERIAAAVGAFVALGREHLEKARAAMASGPAGFFPAFLPVALAGPVLARAEQAGAAAVEGGIVIPQWRRQWWLWRAARRQRF